MAENKNNFEELKNTNTEGTEIISIYRVKSKVKEDSRTPPEHIDDNRENTTYLVFLNNDTFLIFSLLKIYDYECYSYAERIDFNYDFNLDDCVEDLDNYVKDFFEDRDIKINEMDVIKNDKFNLKITNTEGKKVKDVYDNYLDIYKINLIQDDNEKKEIIIDEYGAGNFIGSSYSPWGYFKTDITGILACFLIFD